MNPQTATMPGAPQAVNTQAPAAHANPVSSGPSLVTNIPVHTQALPVAVNEDAELDQIMHDVGQELKKETKPEQKHGLLGFLHHEPKPLVKVNNSAAKKPALTPDMDIKSIPAPSAAVPAATQPITQTQAQPQAATKPKTKRNVPVFVIFVALCVAGFLAAAAVAAYRQS